MCFRTGWNTIHIDRTVHPPLELAVVPPVPCSVQDAEPLQLQSLAEPIGLAGTNRQGEHTTAAVHGMTQLEIAQVDAAE